MPRTKKIYFLVIFLMIQFNTYAHPYYVSLCQINFNEGKQNVEVSIKIFADDLIKALKSEDTPYLFLGEEKELLQTDSLINNYIQKTFSLLLDEKQITLSFIGKEMDTDAVWCYFESDKINEAKKIEVHSELLTEIYKTQNNIIQITKSNETRNMLLTQQKTEDTLNLW